MMLEIILQIFVVIILVAVVYMSFHIVDEQKRGEEKPFFWEKKRDKNDY